MDLTVPIGRDVPCRVLLPKGRAPHAAVLALHGYGWDEERFARVLRIRFGTVPWAWLVPRGPWRVLAAPGEVGFGWLVGSRERPDPEGMEGTERLLGAIVRKAPVDPGRVAVMGFSQGGFAAGVAALRNPGRYRLGLVLGGYINPALVPGGLARGARLAFLHGRQDREVPLTRAKRSVAVLAEAGIEAPLETFPGGHKLSRAMADAAKRMLAEALR